MAVAISLNILDAKGEKLIGRHCLYFGKELRSSSWSGWDWVKNQRMTIDGPWTLDNDKRRTFYEISELQLKRWIEEGFLSLDAMGLDRSVDFLSSYPENSIFRLNFTDWS